MITRDFWEQIDAQLAELRRAKSAADVFAACPRIPMYAASNADGFFAGGGGDGTVLEALLEAGWTTVQVDAWYYFAAKAPNGDVVTYVEGDLYAGNQMLPHNPPKET